MAAEGIAGQTTIADIPYELVGEMLLLLNCPRSVTNAIAAGRVFRRAADDQTLTAIKAQFIAHNTQTIDTVSFDYYTTARRRLYGPFHIKTPHVDYYGTAKRGWVDGTVLKIADSGGGCHIGSRNKFLVLPVVRGRVHGTVICVKQYTFTIDYVDGRICGQYVRYDRGRVQMTAQFDKGMFDGPVIHYRENASHIIMYYDRGQSISIDVMGVAASYYCDGTKFFELRNNEGAFASEIFTDLEHINVAVHELNQLIMDIASRPN